VLAQMTSLLLSIAMPAIAQSPKPSRRSPSSHPCPHVTSTIDKRQPCLRTVCEPARAASSSLERFTLRLKWKSRTQH
jgi:hypothetical protein